MILAALNDYYQRLLDDPESGIAPPGYTQEKIGYAVSLDEQGRITHIADLRIKSEKKITDRLVAVPASVKRSGTGSKPFFLWDKTSYVFGVSKAMERAAQNHEAFKAFHRDVLADTQDAGLRALLAFLDAWTPDEFGENEHIARHPDLLDTNVIFRMGGAPGYLHDRHAAREVWSNVRAEATGTVRGTCLVTGKRASLARLHPSIKGVNGAQSSGASIVSFNLESFTSYRKIQGENAPVAEDVAEAYVGALNHLLSRDGDNHQRLQIGDTTVVFWAQAADPEAAKGAERLVEHAMGSRSYLDDETDSQSTTRLGYALEKVREARPLRELGDRLDDGTRIYVLGLAPNASRLSVRFWETQTLGEFMRRLMQHYDDLELKPMPWRGLPSPSLLALQTAVFIDGKPKPDSVSPKLAGDLTRSILTGTRYPKTVLTNLVMRFRADGNLSALRVALCRAVLVRDARLDRQQGRDTTKEEPPVSLDLGNKDPSYVLGRLFSMLENAQRVALLTEVNATIRDRYYGAASAMPAAVFPLLLRHLQNHLAKIRKDRAGLSYTMEKDIANIVELLPPTFPRHLDIRQQGTFAIGYYHQTQIRFARKDGQDATDTESEGAAE